MSEYVFNQITPPSAPASGKAELYFDSADGKFHAIDSSSNDVPLAGMATKDYRAIKVTNIFQGTTTYTPTTGAKALYIECIGAGGAGGGCLTAITNSAGAGGGGGGGYSALWYTGTMKSPFSVVVGLGGAAGSVGNNPGGNGNDTTFDSPSICTGKGGTGGAADTVTTIHVGGAGGAGGASASGVGDIKLDGDAGGTGLALAAAQALSGRGGNGGGLSGAGGQEKKNATGSGNPGLNYGGGGSGGTIISGGASQAGGAGGNGLIRVTEYA